ncbi:hypothetical protein INT45_009133 [Circinella minor]|uniref:Uncharacterized protein n=1 Tax=Circinella minor TaxID=1195481 RepID=A0A8H7SH79_9FUNG|nr:hypothetical protein INT45_009133 [Circinella minor]
MFSQHIVDDLPNIMYKNPAVTTKKINHNDNNSNSHLYNHENDDDGDDSISILHYYYANNIANNCGGSYFQYKDTCHDPFQEINNIPYHDVDLDTLTESSLSLELEDDGDERVYYEKEEYSNNENKYNHQYDNIEAQQQEWNNNDITTAYRIFSPSIYHHQKSDMKAMTTLKAIPMEHRFTMQWIHREWIGFCITLFLNFFASLATFFDRPPLLANTAHISLGVAAAEGILYSLASYFLWKKPACNAYMTSDPVQYSKLHHF